MIVKETFYKDIPAFELITKTVRAVVIPAQGGKVASFQGVKNGKEYLVQNPSERFLRMGLQDDFEKRECAGFDDMFPTIAPVKIACEDGTILDYPDHGEICRLTFTPKTGRDFLALRCKSAAFGYACEKTFAEDAGGGLRIDYRIESTASRDLDALWAAHFLLNVEKGGELLLPFEDGEPTDIVANLDKSTPPGTRVPLHDGLLLANWPYERPACRKLYFPRKVPAGFVGYRAPTGDVLMMEFDREQLPYLGLWINLGYLHGDYCVGLEPCSVGYDTVKNAETYGQRDVLKKGTYKMFFVKLSIR